MTIHLPQDVERSIEAAVHGGLFASVDDALATAWRHLEQQRTTPQGDPKATRQGAEPLAQSIRKPIWEEIQELTADIPDEVWDALPTDLAEQHDHYIYGTPKRPSA